MKHKSIVYAPTVTHALLCHNTCAGMKMEGQEYDVEHGDKERKTIGNGEEQKCLN